jgi:hypothetical protein
MPLPKTKDVGKLISFLKREKPGMKHAQRVAIALDTARKVDPKVGAMKKRLKK